MHVQETIFVFSAHNDDFVLGAGGTIAEYTKQGKKVEVFIFSYGEKSHVWLKNKTIYKVREQEAKQAGVQLRCQVHFFDLKELSFVEGAREKGTIEWLCAEIEKKRPTKLFTHSIEDPHPDHRAVHTITHLVYERLNKKPDVYMYSVWNAVSFNTKYPALFVNTRDTFWQKMRALRSFKSQYVHMAYPLLLLLLRDFRVGIKMRSWFGELFYKIK